VSTPDPQRLEDGLRQLRELGYLSTPASTYVARRAGGGRSIGRAVMASSLWIGAGTGWAFALLLVASALLADPELLQWPRSLLVLFIELGLLLSLLFAFVTGLFSAGVLFGHRGSGSIRGSLVERALLLLPGLLATLYLVDRVGRSLLEGAAPGLWWWGGALLVLFAASFAALLSGAMRGALAMVRLQLHGVYAPPRVSRSQQLMPAITGAVLAILLLSVGPYRGATGGTWFDEVEVQTSGAGAPLLLIAIDGLSDPPALQGLQEGVVLPSPGIAPTAFWNEIATGFAASEHGLASASTTAPRGWQVGGERLRGDPVLSTLLERLMPGVGLAAQHAADRRELRRPPVWEIAARAGRTARVINWWGSYPAARATGLEVISDRQWLRHSGDAQVDSLLAAPDYLLLDDQQLESMRERSAALLDTFAAFAIVAARLYAGADRAQWPPVFELAASADLYHLQRASEAAVSAGPELVAVLLSGPDILARSDTAPGLRQAWEDFLLGRVARLADRDGRDFWLLATGRGPGGVPRGSWGVGPWSSEPAESAARILEQLGIVPAADMAGVSTPSAPATYGLLRSTGELRARVAPDLDQLRSLGYIGD